MTAKVALKAATGLDVGVSDFLEGVRGGLFEELVERTLDEDALRRVVSGEEGVGAEMERDAKASYEALKEFIDKQEAKTRNKEEYVNFRDKMRRVGDGQGGGGVGPQRKRSEVAGLAQERSPIRIDAALFECRTMCVEPST